MKKLFFVIAVCVQLCGVMASMGVEMPETDVLPYGLWKGLDYKMDEFEKEKKGKVEDLEFCMDTFMIYAVMDLAVGDEEKIMAWEAKAWDGLLNKYYKLLMGSLDAEGKETLKSAQRSWIAYRDADDKLYAKGHDEWHRHCRKIERLRRRVIEIEHLRIKK